MRWVRVTSILLLIVCTALTIASEFERFWWRSYLASQFRLEYFALAVVLVLAIPVLRLKRSIVLVPLICAAVNAKAVVPLLVHDIQPSKLQHSDVASNSPKTMRLLQVNLNTKNKEYSKVLSYVRSVQPDVILIEELTEEWQQFLTQNLSEYSHSLLIPRVDTYGIGMFSKLPVVARAEYYGSSGHPSIVCTLTGLQQPVTLLHTHIQGPVREALYKLHKEELETLQSSVPKLPKPLIFAGDMNCTATSYLLSDLLVKANLHDSQAGLGVQLTWPAPFYWRKVPISLMSIDHFFLSSELETRKRTVGPCVGSDHFPVYVDVALVERSSGRSG